MRFERQILAITYFAYLNFYINKAGISKTPALFINDYPYKKKVFNVFYY